MISLHRLFAGISVLAVAVALVWGAWIVGSPMAGRAYRFDERRVEDLRAIVSEIWNITLGQVRTENPTALENPLPASLQEVADQAVYQRPSIVDPETNVPYEYVITDSTHYQLCATFAQERRRQYDIFWDHPAGRHCYVVDALQPWGK